MESSTKGSKDNALLTDVLLQLDKLEQEALECKNTIANAALSVDNYSQSCEENLKSLRKTCHYMIKNETTRLKAQINRIADDASKTLEALKKKCEKGKIYLSIVSENLRECENNEDELFVYTLEEERLLDVFEADLTEINELKNVQLLSFKKGGLMDFLDKDGKLFGSYEMTDEVHGTDLQLTPIMEFPDAFYTGMVLLPDNRFVLVDRNNCTAILINTSDWQSVSINLPGKPWAICVMSPSTVAITQPAKSRVVIVQVSGKDRLTIIEKIRVGSQCYGIAHYNKRLVVGFQDPGKVAIVGNGDFVKRASGKNIFKYPNYIVATTHTAKVTIFVSDNGTSTITMMNEELDVLKSFSYPVLGGPRDMAFIKSHLLLVCDNESSVLFCIDTRTEVCTRLLGWKNGLQFPRCIAYNEKDKKAFVTSDISEIFEIEFV